MRATLPALAVALGPGLLLACGGLPFAPGARLDAAAAPTAFTRDVDAQVHYGFPGRWSWELAYRAPDQFRLSIRTTGATQHYVFDGSALESWVGGVRVSRDVRDGSAYASIGRWLGVTSLAALPEEPARWEDAREGPFGDDVPYVLSFRFPDGSDPYWLGFDESGRVVAARGPIEIPGIGAGRLAARFQDFRSVAGREVPFTASYRLNGEPFFEERVTRFVPEEAQLDPVAAEGRGSRSSEGPDGPDSRALD
jgi:hypothetical protein